MKQLLVFDRTENLVATLANDTSDKCPYWEDEVNETLDGRQLFIFTVPYSHDASRYHLKIGNYIAFMDDDGIYRMFNIIKLEDSKGIGEDRKKVSCEGHYYELIDFIVEKSSYYGTNVTQAFQSAIAGSRWQVGTVDQTIPYPEFVDTNDSSFLTNAFTMSPALANIQKVADKWEVEVSYRITTDGRSITGRYLDVYKQRGSNNGVRFTFDQNVQSVTRTADFTDLKTRMYGKGQKIAYNTDGTEEFHDFAEAVWSVANGDPVDKPAGQIYVDIPEAITKYGIKTGVYTDQTADINTLLSATYKALKDVSTPKLTYDMSVYDIEKENGDQAYKVRLGDTVSLLDKDFDLQVKARVIEISYSLNDPTRTKLTLGNAKSYITDAFGISDPFTDGKPIIPSVILVSIEEGTRSFSFDTDGNPLTTPTQYIAKVLVDNVETIPDSYYWLAGGVLIGSASSNTFTPTVDVFNTRESYVLLQCVVQNVTFESKIPIATSKAGQDGANGSNGVNGVSFRAKGAWNSSAAYVNDANYIDIVTSGGSSYYCKVSNTNQSVTNITYWGILSAKGDTGIQGLPGATGVSYRNLGAWVSTTAYVNNSSYIDTVNYNGSLYACKVSNTGQTPTDTASWTLLVSKGNTGATGATGANGADGVDANLLDWVSEWNGQVTQIKSASIVSPKVFAGINGGTSSDPILTGIAIGRDVLGGTDANIGLVAYNANTPTVKINTDGSAVFGSGTNKISISATGTVSIPGALIAGTINGVTITGSTLKTNTTNHIAIEQSAIKGYNGTTLALDLGVTINGSYNLPYISFISGLAQGGVTKTIGLSSAGELSASIDNIENPLAIYGALTVNGNITASSYLVKSRTLEVGSSGQCDISYLGYITAPKVSLTVNPTWTTPTLGSGWSQMTGQETFAYYKDGFGFVHFKGSIKGGTFGTDIFILPTSCHPFSGAVHGAILSDSGGDIFGSVYVGPTGNVRVGKGTNTIMCFDGFSFYAGVV